MTFGSWRAEPLREMRRFEVLTAIVTEENVWSGSSHEKSFVGC